MFIVVKQGKRTNWETRSAQSGFRCETLKTLKKKKELALLKRKALHVHVKHMPPAQDIFDNSLRLETEPFLLQIIFSLSETTVVCMFNTKMFDILCVQQNP